MKTLRVTIEAEGGGSVAASLPAEDVLNAIVTPAILECDDGEWAWHMQENEPDRHEAVQGFVDSARELAEAIIKEDG